MLKSEYILISIILAAILSAFSGCGKNKPESDKLSNDISYNKIKTSLDSGKAFDREEPFYTRAFDPYLDSMWIGSGVSYGCYRIGQVPGVKGPSDSEILEDLNIIKKYWHLIRVYGADNDTRTILEVIRKNKLPIKMILGIWLEPEIDNPYKNNSNVEQVLNGIELANEYDEIIRAVSVGNETQVFWSWHKMNPENLIKYIRAVRKSIVVPVTTADDYNFWNKPESKAVAGEIDFIMTHMHPLWNGIQLENSMQWVGQIYDDIRVLHPEASIIIGETGWATDYNADKKGPGEQGTLMKGEVSPKAQAVYLKLHNRWVDSSKVPTFLFEAFDEPWKGGGENSGAHEVEKHWGVFKTDRTPKESILKLTEN